MTSLKPDAFTQSIKEAKDNSIKDDGAVGSQSTKSQGGEREIERYPVRQTQVYSNKSFPDRIYGKHELFPFYFFGSPARNRDNIIHTSATAIITVGGLESCLTEDDLETFFSRYGGM